MRRCGKVFSLLTIDEENEPIDSLNLDKRIGKLISCLNKRGYKVEGPYNETHYSIQMSFDGCYEEVGMIVNYLAFATDWRDLENFLRDYKI